MRPHLHCTAKDRPSATDLSRSWGLNYGGVLGHGPGQDGEQRVPKRVEALAEAGRCVRFLAVGDGHMCVLTTAGELLAWGRLFDANGQELHANLPTVLQPPMLHNESIVALCSSKFSSALSVATDRNRLLTLSEGEGWRVSDLPQ